MTRQGRPRRRARPCQRRRRRPVERGDDGARLLLGGRRRGSPAGPRPSPSSRVVRRATSLLPSDEHYGADVSREAASCSERRWDVRPGIIWGRIHIDRCLPYPSAAGEPRVPSRRGVPLHALVDLPCTAHGRARQCGRVGRARGRTRRCRNPAPRSWPRRTSRWRTSGRTSSSSRPSPPPTAATAGPPRAGYTASVNYVFNRLSAAGFTVVRQNCTSGCTAGAGPNVIADWPGGDANNVYMFGAHLDGVTAGPGINDNASGSATLLELALTLAAHEPDACSTTSGSPSGPTRSRASTARSSTPTRCRRPSGTRIRGYFNFDMVASTNGGYFINRITSGVGQVAEGVLRLDRRADRGEHRGRRALRRRVVQRDRRADLRRRRRRQRG